VFKMYPCSRRLSSGLPSVWQGRFRPPTPAQPMLCRANRLGEHNPDRGAHRLRKTALPRSFTPSTTLQGSLDTGLPTRCASLRLTAQGAIGSADYHKNLQYRGRDIHA